MIDIKTYFLLSIYQSGSLCNFDRYRFLVQNSSYHLIFISKISFRSSLYEKFDKPENASSKNRISKINYQGESLYTFT